MSELVGGECPETEPLFFVCMYYAKQQLALFMFLFWGILIISAFLYTDYSNAVQSGVLFLLLSVIHFCAAVVLCEILFSCTFAFGM